MKVIVYLTHENTQISFKGNSVHSSLLYHQGLEYDNIVSIQKCVMNELMNI